MPMKKGNKEKKVYYTPKEWEKICERAAFLNMKTGTYIKKISTYGEIKHFDTANILKLTLEINKYGVNLNQIAHLINATSSVYQMDMFKIQNDFDDMRKYVKACLSEIKYKLI